MANRHAEAEAAFRRAVELHPDMREAQLNLGFALVHQGKFADAIAVLAPTRTPGERSLYDVLMYCVLSVLQDEHAADPETAVPCAPLPDEPLVSVIIPTRDRPALLRDALGSVGRQGYQRWEAIVVNDGGEPIAIPHELRDRATGIDLRPGRGVAHARNRALGAARGEIIAFLDDDDLFLPHHLETLVRELRASGAAFAYTRSAGVEERLERGVRTELRRGAALEYRYARALLLVRNLIPTANWAVRRECFAHCGGFDETLPCAEDWDMLLRLSAATPFHQVPEVTAEIRVRPAVADNVTRRVPLAPTCELLYRRFPAGEQNSLIALGRGIYLESIA